MLSGEASNQPPSPPGSADGDLDSAGGVKRRSTRPSIKPEFFTPPPTLSRTTVTGMSGRYETYEDPTHYHAAPTLPMYYSTPQQASPLACKLYSSPERSLQSHRGGSLGTPASPKTEPARASQSPRPKRKTKSRTGKIGEPTLTEPLSVCTRSYNIPVKDMLAWVNRPASERLQEAEQRKGKIARPMNSFMLYRSAYAERAKKFASENNHQVVSKLAGLSWPLEPKEIREMYEQYAIMERDNHAMAHPGYKFAPNKSSKRGRDHDGDHDDDSDGEWDGSGRSKRSCSRRFDSRSASSTPFGDDRPPTRFIVQQSHYHQPLSLSLPPPPSAALHVASYDGGGHTPMVLPHPEYDFYTASAAAPSSGANIYGEPLEEPFAQYAVGGGGGSGGSGGRRMGGGLVGLPNTAHHELLTSYPPPEPIMHVPVLDPRLGGGNVDMGYNVYFEDGHGYGGEVIGEMLATYGEAYHPGLATLTTMPDEAWTMGGEPGSEFDAEFRKMA